MSLYNEVEKLINSSYGFERLCYKVVNLLSRGNIYISVEDIQAVWFNRFEDHVTIAIYLGSIEINVRIYKDDDKIYVSVYPLFRCECGGE